MTQQGMTIDVALKQAMNLQQAGRISEAVRLYQAVLAARPHEVNALHLLGCCRLQAGNPGAALELFDATLRAAPSFAMAHSNRAVVLRRLGRLPDALAGVDRALAHQPDLFDAHCNRCAILNDLNRPAEALHNAERAAALRPGDAQAQNNRGEALRRLKRWDEAIACYDAAVRSRPGFEEAHFNRGLALIELGRFEEALTSIEQALAIQPRSAESHYLRGQVLWRLRRLDEAIAAFDAAIAIQPDLAKAHGSRGETLRELGLIREALASCDHAIALQPDLADAHGARANILCGMGQYEEALASYNRTLALEPNMAEAYANRGIALVHFGKNLEAIADLDRALELKPDLPWVRGHLIYNRMQCCIWQDLEASWQQVLDQVEQEIPVANPFTLLGTPATPAQLQRCARNFNHKRYPEADEALWRGERHAHDRIRIGYFSADFHSHATAYLMAELFERHDRSRFEIVAFSFGPPAQDAWRERLVKAFDRFHELSGASDGEIARLARAQEIDIAVDLKGYTQDLRTRIFAWRPAPIQVNYLGYPGTMGAPYIDYLIADPVLIPVEHRPFYDEKIAYLPDSYQPNDSTKSISSVPMTRNELGLPEEAFVFCCFNNSFKITPDVFDIWMRLLDKVAGSVLWLLEGNAVVVDNLRAEACRRGIAPERLVFAPRMDLDRHLARHRHADLFLDTLYYNAHTTASDALWTGLPVLTCPGRTFASRVAASLNTAVGLPDLIAGSIEDYESMALALATDPERLRAVRARLAANRLVAPLFDTVRYTRNLESLYLSMHDRFISGLPPDHITELSLQR